MARTIFVSEDYIKSNTVIDDNVNAKTLLSIAYDAQEFYIEPLLGTRLYNKLKSDVEANSVTGDYLTLLNDYVVPTLVKWVEVEEVVMNHYRLRNKGTMIKSSENSQPASFRDLEFRLERASQKADQYGIKMVDYLQCNTDLFPEYCENDEGGELQPVRSAAKSGMYLGNAKKYYGKERDVYRYKKGYGFGYGCGW